VDIQQIWNRIALDSFDAADRVEAAIWEAIELIAENPSLAHARDDITPRYRFYTVYSYQILIRAESKPTEVSYVLHASRDLKTFFESGPGRP
jgi:plasmid stabilization system protein ParE